MIMQDDEIYLCVKKKSYIKEVNEDRIMIHVGSKRYKLKFFLSN